MITVNWSKLPLDLLARIVENHLQGMDDVIMFSSVCISWNQAARACNRSKLTENWSRQMPWLMLTDGNDNEPCNEQMEDEISLDERDDGFACTLEDYGFQKGLYDDRRGLLNLSNGRNKLYRLSIPETYGKACWGSRSGWIVTLGLKREMHLFNPLTKSQLPLPSQTTFRYAWKSAEAKTIRAAFFNKVVVLRVPQDNHNNNVAWVVVAILSGNSHLGIAVPGDASWTHIRHGGPCITDVVYCNRMKSLVFIDEEASLFYYDVHNLNHSQKLKVCLKAQGILFPELHLLPHQPPVDTHMYLVQSGDDLLAIVRFKRTRYWDRDHVHDNCHKMDYFKILRYGFATTGSWEELKNGIGNVAVYVGGMETMCIDASVGGCRSNCIYFCDVHRDRLTVMGT